MVTSFLVAETVQLTLIDALRSAFSTNTEYPWLQDDEATSIGIYSRYPRTMPPYPSIIVQEPVVDNLPRTFNNDLVHEVYGLRVLDGLTIDNGLCFKVFGGACEIQSTITVVGNTSPERRRIVDYINTYLRFAYRDYLEDRQIDVTDIDMGGDSVEIYGATLLHTSSLNLNVFTTWNFVEQDIALIEGVELDGLGVINPNGTTYY